MTTQLPSKGRARRLDEPRLIRVIGAASLFPTTSRARPGFTLIEVIGVLAIVTILAVVFLPNILHSIELGAAKAEAQKLTDLGDQTKQFVTNRGYLPGTIPIPAGPVLAWNVDLASYSNLAAADVLTNARQVARLYVVDPNAPGQRILMLSSMRANLTLPTAAVVGANFAGIWDTQDSQVPPGFPVVWSTPVSQTTLNLGYLSIQRITLSDLQTAAVRAESQNTDNLGNQTKLFLSNRGYLPGATPIPAGPALAWNVDLTSYSNLAAGDILTNARLVNRINVIDPISPQRVLILSSMRPDLTLPTVATARANFAAIWDAPNNTVPAGFPAVWSTPPASRVTWNLSFLVIQRISVMDLETPAVRAEVQVMQTLGEAVKSFLRGTSTLPALATWNTQLSPYTDFAFADILTNKRGMNRTYVLAPIVAPAVVSNRAMVLSSMINGVAVPTAANINTTPRFDDIWNTRDGVIPSGASLPLWGSWNANNIQYLTVQRVSLQTINDSDLQPMTITVNKAYPGGTISYRLISGTTGLTISQNTLPTPLPALNSVTIANVNPGDQLRLYTDAAYTTLGYSYIFSANTTNTLNFNFVDSNPSGTPYWRPQ